MMVLIRSLPLTFFAFQIYCDFSGYSDIAIGASLIMGFRLMQNFRRPYFAASVQEFWGRWHISLSTWFRDYVYIPLGGNRVSNAKWYFNIMLVFVVSGLWHGAYYTFIIWGFLHGFYILFGRVTLNFRQKITALVGLDKFPRLIKFLNITITFHLVLFAWIFFRASYITHAKIIIKNILSIDFASINDLATHFITSFGGLHILEGSLLTMYETRVAVIAVLIMEGIHYLQENNHRLITDIANKPTWYRWSGYIAFALLVLLFGKFAEEQQFIYFQF